MGMRNNNRNKKFKIKMNRNDKISDRTNNNQKDNTCEHLEEFK